MKKVLSRLGISKIFEEHGDLTRISSHRSLKVGEVSHLAALLSPPTQESSCSLDQSHPQSRQPCDPQQTTPQPLIPVSKTKIGNPAFYTES